MEWAKERPYLMDELFDAIIIAFENFNQRLQMSQTINSGDSPVRDVANASPKLTLEQIG